MTNESAPSLSTEDARTLQEYFLMNSIPHSTSEEIQNYINLEGLGILPEDFPRYSSDLEGKARSLINNNPNAREFYLRFETLTPVKKQIGSIQSYGRKYLKRKFKDALKDVYAASEMGFKLDGDVTTDRTGKTGVHILFREGRSNNPSFVINKDGAHFWSLYIYHLSNICSFKDKKEVFSLGGFFNNYWSFFMWGDSNAGNHIKRIIGLEEDVQLFLADRKRNLNDLFGEK